MRIFYYLLKFGKIKFVDHKAKKVEVIPAKDGKKPIFFGNSGVVHQRIREKMVEVLYSKIDYNFLDQPSRNEIESLRKEFSVFKIKDLSSQCPLQSRKRTCNFLRLLVQE